MLCLPLFLYHSLQFASKLLRYERACTWPRLNSQAAQKLCCHLHTVIDITAKVLITSVCLHEPHCRHFPIIPAFSKILCMHLLVDCHDCSVFIHLLRMKWLCCLYAPCNRTKLQYISFLYKTMRLQSGHAGTDCKQHLGICWCAGRRESLKLEGMESMARAA